MYQYYVLTLAFSIRFWKLFYFII